MICVGLLFGVDRGIDILDGRRAVVKGGLWSLEADLRCERELRWIVWRMSLMNCVFVFLVDLMDERDCLCLSECTALVVGLVLLLAR